MTLKDHPCFKELAEDVRSFSQGQLLSEILNTGNWGDALVHAGLTEFLSEYGIQTRKFYITRFTKLRRKRLRTLVLTKLLTPRTIICGAGIFRDVHPRHHEVVAAAREFREVLVLPSSFPLMPNFDLSKTRLWRRDAGESLQNASEARFCHDMAFFLSPKPRKATKKIGVLFRTDAESDDFTLPQGNVDLSAQGTHASDPEIFFDRVGEFEVIATNRLHVGIAGALLGRTVHLFGARTNKIKSIFESSLNPFYKNIHYHDGEPNAAFLKSF